MISLYDEGYLLKKKNLGIQEKNWKRRWMTLNCYLNTENKIDKVILEYCTDCNGEKKGSHYISKDTEFKVLTDVTDGKSYCFQLLTDEDNGSTKKVRYFAADTLELQTHWLLILDSVITFLNRSSNTPIGSSVLLSRTALNTAKEFISCWLNGSEDVYGGRFMQCTQEGMFFCIFSLPHIYGITYKLYSLNILLYIYIYHYHISFAESLTYCSNIFCDISLSLYIFIFYRSKNGNN